MSNPKQSVPSSADLDCCRRVLTALVDAESPLPTIDPVVADVVRLAARLSRLTKRNERWQARCRDVELLDMTGIRAAAVLPRSSSAGFLPGVAILDRPRHCYVCKVPFTALHPFYDCLCAPCGDFNLSKRHQTADLAGRCALVTGARVKIGFQVALRLLRAGAFVIATTRFPHDAAQRFAAEPDAEAWADRLSLHGLDLRFLAAVERFAEAIGARHSQLDILVHNAAQTVRRPPAFYEHLLAAERLGPEGLPALARAMLAPVPSLRNPQPGTTRVSAGQPVLDRSIPTGWAEMTQLALLPGDERRDLACFPEGALDSDQQQIDRRPQNSWGMPLGAVSTVELLEVQAVNCLAPFLLLRGLEPMLRGGGLRDRHVVLVSAVEGQFGTRWKSGRHPHTNMAKAALNMIVRTAADAYAAERIYLTCVDTGWITNEAAHPAAERMRDEGFRPPLDAEDGAARVLDPVFAGINSGTNAYGVFLKDYHPAAW